MSADAKESAFQGDVIGEMLERGWLRGEPAKYDRELALYPQDCLAFVKTTQPIAWEKYQTGNKIEPVAMAAGHDVRPTNNNGVVVQIGPDAEDANFET